MARILVVDDDPDILKMADLLLRQSHHEVVTANHAVKALEYLDRAPFDLLISDANMPQFTGFDLVKTVRANPKLNHLAIAMLTGLRERKDVEKAVRVGVDDYIVKPLDPLLLVQKVEALLSQKTPQQALEIKFVKGSPLAKATIEFALEIESVSELGVILRSHVPMEVGSKVDMQSLFFKELGDQAPPLKVLHCEAIAEENCYRVQLVFLGATESFLQKIRRYVFSHGASHKAVS